MTHVKICGLTSVEDALWAAECGADLLGLIFYPPSQRAVSPAVAEQIAQAVRDRYQERSPLLVGVFVNEAIPAMREVQARCGLDLIQLHGHEPPELAAGLGLPYILARRVSGPDALRGIERYAPWALLLDAYDPVRPGGSGTTWRWDDLGHAAPAGQRIILAGGLTPENVLDGLRAMAPWGVDVASGVEARPGIKDPERVARFIRTVKEHDSHDCAQ